MKKIRLSFILLFALSTIFTFVSCEDDGYSLGDFVISLATVNQIDESAGTYYLTMDNGTTLWPVNQTSRYWSDKQRVLVNFTILGDSIKGYDRPVKINSLREILTKDIEDLTEENKNEIGDDPIKILDLWTGDNYLNIHFGYNTGGEQVHRISLVHNRIEPVVDDNGAIVLEFRHNAYDDPEHYGVKSYVAYDLRPLQIENEDSVNLVIKVQDFNNETKEYKITYKYKNVETSTDNKKIDNMPESVNNF